MRRLATPLLVAEVGARLLAVEIALSLFPLKRLLRRAARGRCVTADPESVHHPRLVSRYVQGIERRLFRRPHCLRTALVVFWMGGRELEFFLGVPTSGELSEAHAWVERRGEVFPAKAPREYGEIFRFPKSTAEAS